MAHIDLLPILYDTDSMNEQELKLEFEADIIKVKQKILNYNRSNTSGRRLFSKALKKEICNLRIKYHDKNLSINKALDLSNQTLDRWSNKKRTPAPKKVPFKKLTLEKKIPLAIVPKIETKNLNLNLSKGILLFNHSVVLILLTLYLTRA